MKDRRKTLAAVTAAVTAYMEEEEALLRPAVIQQGRGPAPVSYVWGNFGREEMMRVLWQRGIAPRVMTFGSCVLG